MICATFYIGLHPGSNATDTRRCARSVRSRRAKAERILDSRYDAWTAQNATGRWKGESEPTLIATVYLAGPLAVVREDAHETASKIAVALEQDCVMISLSDNAVEFISADSQ